MTHCALVLIAVFVAGPAWSAKRRSVTFGSRTSPVAKLYRGDAQRRGQSSETAPQTLQRQRWTRELTGPVRGVVFHEGFLFVGASGGLFVYDAATGGEAWSYADPSRTFSPPAILGDMVYTSAGNRFFAIDRRTRALAWLFDTDSSIGSTPPLIIDGVAYVGSANGTVYAIDLQSRGERWHVATGGGVRTYLTSTAGLLFVTNNGGILRALDVSDGHLVWTKTLPADNDWTEVAADDSIVFAGASGNDLYALDAHTGAVRWTFNDTNSERSGWCAPVVSNGVVYAGNRNRRMFAFEAANGRELWRLSTEDAATSDPVLAAGLLYFGVGSHGAIDDEAPRDFYAVAIDSGTVVSRIRLTGLVLGGCDVGAGAAYVHTLAGRLVAID